jgi:hypothetical protein
MLAEGKPEMVLAFPGGRGTANMVKQARSAGVSVCEVSTTADWSLLTGTNTGPPVFE